MGSGCLPCERRGEVHLQNPRLEMLIDQNIKPIQLCRKTDYILWRPHLYSLFTILVLLCSPQPHNYIPRVYYNMINNTQLGLITQPNEVTIIIASSDIKVFLCAVLTEAVSPMRLELCAGRRDVLRPTQKCFDDDIFHTHHQAWRMRCFIQIGQTAILFKNLKGEICLLSDYLSRPRWYTHLRCPCLPPGGTSA